MVGACGKECLDCFHYGASCDGCFREMSLSYADLCEAYQCALHKGVVKCINCAEFESCITNRESRELCPLAVEKLATWCSCRVEIPDSAH
jgi:hypothetical protein